MKLKEDFIVHKGENGAILLASGESAKSFRGIVRLNATAEEIVSCLQEEISQEELLEKFSKEYPSVAKETLSKDIDNVFAQLKEIHALV